MCLHASQKLFLANFTSAKRSDVLEESTVLEIMKDQLLFSPVIKDKPFGLLLQKLQDEIHKALLTV